ncbi:hypothetical protein CPB83DRAFT_771325, partial [Crepidotus variabilis]
LALFCAACPQPGLNLPMNHQNDPDSPPLMRILAVDGNENADHIKSRSTAGDFALTQGQAFMTEPVAYKAFLVQALLNAPQFTQKPTCNNHNVIKHANCRNANLDITGIAAHACARHGCFAPGSVVDLQKGERQMNIDYSVSEALTTTRNDGLKSLLLIYDVMCQYKVHLGDRFDATPEHLQWPDSLDTVLSAIGKFHVHTHQESCLYRYSPSYIPDAAQVAGEIVESLWARLNKISVSLRTASIQHRIEVLDDHMNNSNFKKIIHAGEHNAEAIPQGS